MQSWTTERVIKGITGRSFSVGVVMGKKEHQDRRESASWQKHVVGKLRQVYLSIAGVIKMCVWPPADMCDRCKQETWQLWNWGRDPEVHRQDKLNYGKYSQG